MLLRSIAALLALVVLGAHLASAEEKPASAANRSLSEAQKKLASAIRLQLERKYKESLEAYREALLLDSSLKGVQYQMAVTAMNAGDEVAAKSYAYEAIGKSDSVVQAYNLLGMIAARSGDAATAEWAFERATIANPVDPMAYYNWSEVLRSRNEPRLAIAKLRSAMQRNPGEPLYALKLRLAKVEAGDERDLLEEVDAQLKLNPPSADWLLTAAAIALNQGQFDEAVTLLNLARRSMQPILFLGIIQEDSLFRKFRDNPKISPFYDVKITTPEPKAESGR